MAVLQHKINVSLSAFLILFTIAVKIWCVVPESSFKLISDITGSFTRVCRAQFECQDVAEAQATCGPNQESETPESDPSSVRAIEANRDLTNSALMTSAGVHTSILTWRLPDWVNFTYSSVRKRIHYPSRRLPIPFRRHSAFSRLDGSPSDPSDPTIQDPDDTSTATPPITSLDINSKRDEHATVFAQPGLSLQEQPRERDRILESHGLVSRHPRPVPWDDQPDADLPYDNPYYTRAINNVLWLPRDPFGVLDLDDTIDMRVSLTSDHNAGQIGTMLGAGETSHQERASFPSPTFDSAGPRRQYTGSEEIALPEAIAKRVQHIEQEHDVEYADGRQQSIFGRRSSGSLSMEMRGIRHSPSIRSLPIPFRSRSEIQTPTTPPMHPSRSISDPRMSRPYDEHAHSNILPITHHHPETDDFLAPPTLMRTLTVTTQEAVTQEVRAEEEARNQQTNDAAERKQSWFTSWLFARV